MSDKNSKPPSKQSSRQQSKRKQKTYIQSTLGFTYEEQKQEYGRCIFGTLTTDPKKEYTYTGNDEERLEILNDLKTCSESVNFVLVAREKCKSEAFHYHFVVKFRNVIRKTICNQLYEYFYTKTGASCNKIEFTSKQPASAINYTAKEEDVIWYKDEDSTINIEFILKRIKTSKENKELISDHGGFEQPSVVNYEQAMISFLILFMNKNNYKVNWYTRKLYNVDSKVFYEELNKEKFSVLFGCNALKRCKEFIENEIFCDLPMWKPNERMVKFKNCYYNIETGKIQSLTECKDIIPVREYDIDFEYSEDKIKPFINMISINMDCFTIESFRKAYGRQFRKKVRNGPILYLRGLPGSGKSTTAIPFCDVFKDIIGEYVYDGAFSMSNIAHYPMIYCDETNPFIMSFSEAKKLLEGQQFKVAKKHSESIYCVPKTMICISNDEMPDIDSPHLKAMDRRINTFHFNNEINYIAGLTDFDDTMREITPYILYWATNTEEH
jgi:hypothetical protein